jgi:hypothetical protein
VGSIDAGVGTYRVLRHWWGFRLEESVVEWTDGSGYVFDVVRVPYPIRNARESWEIDGDGAPVSVTTRVEYDTHLGRFGALLDAALVSHLVRNEMRGGLRGLKRYAEAAATVREGFAADAPSA